jgi:hypothetical protein
MKHVREGSPSLSEGANRFPFPTFN